jgi:virginiamycin B lyase
MNDAIRVLKGRAKDFHPAQDAWEKLLERVKQRARLRRALAGGAALMVTAGLVAGLWVSFSPQPNGKVTGHSDPIEPIENLRVVRSIQFKGLPGAVTWDGQAVWVATSVPEGSRGEILGGVVVRIDSGNHVAGKITIGPGLQDIAYGLGSVWVVSGADKSIVRIDPRTNRLEATIPIARGTSGPFGAAAGEGAVWVTSTDGLTVGAGTPSGAGYVSRIDPATNRVTDSIRLSRFPADVAVGFGSVWVPAPRRMLRIDTSTKQITEIAINGAPSDVAVGGEGVWVTDRSNGAVLRIDPKTNRVAASVSLPVTINNLAVGGGHVWITDEQGLVYRIDPTATALVGDPIAVQNPVGVAVSAKQVWVTSSRSSGLGSGSLNVIRVDH